MTDQTTVTPKEAKQLAVTYRMAMLAIDGNERELIPFWAARLVEAQRAADVELIAERTLLGLIDAFRHQPTTPAVAA